MNPATSPSCDLLIIDEIGKLELWHGIGLASVLAPLASGGGTRSLVLVRESLLAELKEKLEPIELIIFEINDQNRNQIPYHILKTLDESSSQEGEKP